MTGKFTLTALCLVSTAVFADTPDNSRTIHGRNLAGNCTVCHARDADSAHSIPPLAGKPAATLMASLRAFRAGETSATVMHQIVRGYSDEQLELITTWLATHPERPAE